MIAAQALSVRAGARMLLKEIGFEARPGELLAVLGANGAGKSTLLAVLAGERRPDSGNVRMAGRPLEAWSLAERARRRAWVAQDHPADLPFTALEIVLMGRAPHLGGRGEGPAERRIAEAALAEVGLAGFEARRADTLSGGERQRVHLARGLAQVWESGESGYLLLDEPTAWLDLAHQHQALARARAFARAGGTCVAVLHDLNLAAQYADRLLLLHRGRLLALGAPEAVLTPANLRAAYHVEAAVLPHPTLPVPLVVPLAGLPAPERETPCPTP